MHSSHASRARARDSIVASPTPRFGAGGPPRHRHRHLRPHRRRLLLQRCRRSSRLLGATRTCVMQRAGGRAATSATGAEGWRRCGTVRGPAGPSCGSSEATAAGSSMLIARRRCEKWSARRHAPSDAKRTIKRASVVERREFSAHIARASGQTEIQRCLGQCGCDRGTSAGSAESRSFELPGASADVRRGPSAIAAFE